MIYNKSLATKKAVLLTVLMAVNGVIFDSAWAESTDLSPQPKDGSEAIVFQVGVCTHFQQYKGLTSENLSLIAQSGATAIRDEIYWSEVEKKKGEFSVPEAWETAFNEAIEKGIPPLLILSYANPNYDGGNYPLSDEALEAFAKYCEFVVTKFKGKVKFYEVWNEWNGGCGMHEIPGTPEGYVAVLKKVYPRIKKIDPDAIVLGGALGGDGTDGWIDKIGPHKVFDFMDGFSIHPYSYVEKGEDRHPEAWLTRFHRSQALVQKYTEGRIMPIYATETGYPNTLSQNGSSPEDTAKFLARCYLLSRTIPWLKGLWWYDFQDDGNHFSDNESNFGIVRTDLTPKSAYYSLQSIADLVATGKFLGRLETSDPLIYILKFLDKHNQDVWAIWSTHPDNYYQLTIQNSSSDLKPLTVEEVGRKPLARQWGYRPWVTDRMAPVQKNDFVLSVQGMPWLVRGDLSHASVTEVKMMAFPEKNRPGTVRLHLPTTVFATKRDTAKAGSSEGSDWEEINQRKAYTSTGAEWGGKEDLSFRFSTSYDAENLYLTVRVRDDVAGPAQLPAELWKGDSLQLAIQILPRNKQVISSNFNEFSIGDVNGKTVVYREMAQQNQPVGLTEDIKAIRTDADSSDERIYQITVPAKSLGLPEFRSGTTLGFSLVVNDNDGKGRKGFLGWGEGVGLGKDPSLFNWIVFAP